MKRLLLILVAVFLVTGLSIGQFVLGVRAGYNGNEVATNLSSIGSQFYNGFHAGIFSRIGKRIYVAPELLYTFSGGIFTNNNNEGTWNKQKFTLGSLDIPVLLGVKVINAKFFKWRIELGPVASFLIHKNVKDFDDLTGPVTSASFNATNWMIMAGTGIDVLPFTLDVRYEYTFNSLLEDSPEYNFNTHNQFIIVSLGFKLIGNK